MNQIITQHGWALDSSIWNNLKEKFIQKDWLWKDNDRGYFSQKKISQNWIKSKPLDVKMAICHSLGTHLIAPNVLHEASHIVLINSFLNFIPKNHERKSTIRMLQRMEKKFKIYEVKSMLNEFIYRSFLPNKIDNSFLNLYIEKLNYLNQILLFKDFKKLYIEEITSNIINKKTSILILKSKNDLILNESSFDDFIDLLNQKQINKPKLIEIKDQGHLIKGIEIYELIKSWVS